MEEDDIVEIYYRVADEYFLIATIPEDKLPLLGAFLKEITATEKITG